MRVSDGRQPVADRATQPQGADSGGVGNRCGRADRQGTDQAYHLETLPGRYARGVAGRSHEVVATRAGLGEEWRPMILADLFHELCDLLKIEVQ